MMNVKEIVNFSKGRLIQGSEDTIISGITTDTRESCEGKLFIALEGSNFDGHNFAKSAYDKGAVAILTHKILQDLPSNIAVINVEDTLTAMGMLANHWLIKNGIDVVAVVGSAGKTTTKELLRFITCFSGTDKNYNNLVGVPLTIFSLSPKSNKAVIELGSNAPKEIEKLRDITTPEYVIITNIGYGHVEGFGGIEGVFYEKISILENNSDLKKFYINADSDILNRKFFSDSRYDYLKDKMVKFGISEDADIRLLKTESSLSDGNVIDFLFYGKRYTVKAKLLGKHNALNIIAVFGIAKEFGFDDAFITEKISEFKPVNMRGEVSSNSKGFIVINDCYNANFESFTESVDFYSNLECSGKKYLVIGDMFELGNMSDELHIRLGKFISQKNIDCILGLGKMILFTINSINSGKFSKVFETKDEIIKFLNSNLQKGDLVLFKASRGMKFEEIVRGIEE